MKKESGSKVELTIATLYFKSETISEEIKSSGQVDVTFEARLVLTDNLMLSQDIDYKRQLNDESYRINTKSGVSVAINDHVSMGLHYRIKYQSDPPVMVKHSDRQLLSSINFKF